MAGCLEPSCHGSIPAGCKLEARPELLEVARANLRRWLRANRAAALDEWARLLDTMSLPALIELLRASDERATRLRPSSPFAGVLTPQERQAILNDYESRRARAFAARPSLSLQFRRSCFDRQARPWWQHLLQRRASFTRK